MPRFPCRRLLALASVCLLNSFVARADRGEKRQGCRFHAGRGG
ncbi:MAG TPA: hypothetical protein VMV10_03005 [Pirellulales bacterium]|nr:hypothetical protein [Pirellulales bacterium]